jgi:choice-of-anchor A domain-containing protein
MTRTWMPALLVAALVPLACGPASPTGGAGDSPGAGTVVDPGFADPSCGDPTTCCPHGKLQCVLQADGSIVCECRYPDGPGNECVPAASDDAVAAALGFNLFVLGDLTQSGSDTEGRIAVGGDARLDGYSVGTALPPSGGSRDDLVVGETVVFTNGAVPNGNAVFGVLGTFTNVGFGSGASRQGEPLDFGAVAAALLARSEAWGALAPDGTTSVQYYGGSRAVVTLTGTRPGLNVFALRGADLSSTNTLSITAPAGATVLVNVSGAEVQIRGMGFSVQGADREHVIYNLPEATTLALDGVGVEGTILAPRADTSFAGGAINGTLVAASLTGPGESHAHAFAGCTPVL